MVAIDGRVISMHRIREPIVDRNLKISCCNASACDRLIAALGKDAS